jgi:hypothetical protein
LSKQKHPGFPSHPGFRTGIMPRFDGIATEFRQKNGGVGLPPGSQASFRLRFAGLSTAGSASL